MKQDKTTNPEPKRDELWDAIEEYYRKAVLNGETIKLKSYHVHGIADIVRAYEKRKILKVALDNKLEWSDTIMINKVLEALNIGDK